MELKDMFEPLVKFLKNFQRKDKDTISKEKAKERLQLVLMQDRASVSPDFFEMMKKEIIDVIKKYIDIDEETLEVQLTRGFENGDETGPALYANIPIKNIKPIAKKAEVKEEKIEMPTKEEVKEALTQVMEEHFEKIEEKIDEKIEEKVEEKSDEVVKIAEEIKEEAKEIIKENVSEIEASAETVIDENTNATNSKMDDIKAKISEVKDGAIETFSKVRDGAKEGINKIKDKAKNHKKNVNS